MVIILCHRKRREKKPSKVYISMGFDFASDPRSPSQGTWSPWPSVAVAWRTPLGPRRGCDRKSSTVFGPIGMPTAIVQGVWDEKPCHLPGL